MDQQFRNELAIVQREIYELKHQTRSRNPPISTHCLVRQFAVGYNSIKEKRYLDGRLKRFYADPFAVHLMTSPCVPNCSKKTKEIKTAGLVSDTSCVQFSKTVELIHLGDKDRTKNTLDIKLNDGPKKSALEYSSLINAFFENMQIKKDVLIIKVYKEFHFFQKNEASLKIWMMEIIKKLYSGQKVHILAKDCDISPDGMKFVIRLYNLLWPDSTLCENTILKRLHNKEEW